MNLWIPVTSLALFLAVMIARSVRAGRKEGARLEGAFEDLERKKCPSCSRAFGPIDRLSPYAKFIPNPDFDPSPCQNVWHIICPQCRHGTVVGLPADAPVFVIVPSSDAKNRTTHKNG